MGIQFSKYNSNSKRNYSLRNKKKPITKFHMSTRSTRNIKNNLRSSYKIPKCLK